MFGWEGRMPGETPDDWAQWRLVWRMAGATAEVMDEKVAEVRAELAEVVPEHERRMHVPVRDMSPLTAVPFPDEKIPDPQLKQMVELIEREGPRRRIYRPAG